MKRKTKPRPDVVNENPEAGLSVDEENPDEMDEIISLESIEERWPEEAENSLRQAKECDPDLEYKALKEREWEKKMGVGQ